MAALHRTRFVSTEKLAKADIDRFDLEKVPKRLAETYQIFPVLFDAQQSVLSVVTADPDDAVRSAGGADRGRREERARLRRRGRAR